MESMEELKKKNAELEDQVKRLQKELLMQQRRNKVRQYREEFAILPQIEPRVQAWKEEKDWKLEDRKKIIESLGKLISQFEVD